ncbi:MAG TPA: alpha/beta fold hydrolase [bacterium]|nr:alpha/beta fold hydrolase [bacterium]
MTAAKTAQVNGLRLAYRELGDGSPVLLLHGWPTSSFLWREVMRPIARANRVVALDLPGFGASDKPVGIRYSFDFFGHALDLFLAHLGIDQLGVAVHDLGGPVGLHWALDRPERVTKVALLNTLVYPEFSEAVKEFVRACTAPELREKMTSPSGLESIMRDGLADPTKLSADVLAAVQEPFGTAEARCALADAGIGLSRKGFVEIARRLPTLRIPVRVVYGARDRLLPDVADTMARVKVDLPQAEVTVLPDCGHFLQEEAPAEVGELLARFFAP